MSNEPSSPRPSLGRLSVAEFLRDVGDELFRGDRGLPWTLGQLFLRPGWVVRRYLETRDPRLTRPLRLALFCIATAALVLHFAGALESFNAGFAAGAAGAGGSAGASGVLPRAGSAFFGRFDLVLVLCWLPAVAGAMQRAYPGYALNFAEAFVFGLYTLSLLIIILAPLMLLQIDARLWLSLVLLLPIGVLGYAAFDYARPEGHGVARALGAALLGWIFTALLMALALALWAAFLVFFGL